jgi:hypothetical protein
MSRRWLTSPKNTACTNKYLMSRSFNPEQETVHWGLADGSVFHWQGPKEQNMPFIRDIPEVEDRLKAFPTSLYAISISFMMEKIKPK